MKMGILSRFTMLMKANINQIIDQADRPEKVIKTTMQEVTLDLRTLQAETNAAKADENRAKLALNECVADILKMERFSNKALENDDALKAKNFLDQKNELENQKEKRTAEYNKAVIEAKQRKLLEEKLAMDVAQLERRSAALKEKASILEKQRNRNENSSSSFDDYEEKLHFKLDEANALAELRSNSTAVSSTGKSIDEEIAALDTNRDTNQN